MMLALLSISYLWLIGILFNVILLFVGIILMVNRGKVRQIGTGITVAYLTFVAALGIVILVDFIKTDDAPISSSSTSTAVSPPVEENLASRVGDAAVDGSWLR
ncbi:hypothetical protein IA539_07860 [Gordonia sp. zg691]|uniref:Uncharacterized protein n=1 Tax=Gordonia jinghuaiqii TaxID=2758710 RepID=A0A7D7QWZ8_9ACTN|nr:hypothetical protein [Gordonia jinghuaiqii]MBD0861129.1 hypothetical protein [Gordonia jinghuaiqii]MCR5979711.1 hypothetical protein [Gordonia jinghuaiqii]QMT00888.1 hypothetical protein H1R19_18745 [Gordonia jinghuaiqii]